MHRLCVEKREIKVMAKNIFLVIKNRFDLKEGRAGFLRVQVGFGLHTSGSGFCGLEKFTKYVGLKLDRGSGFTK
jgi:hypothetical protein